MSIQRDLGVALQLLLPHQLLSRIVYYAMRWTFRPWKRLVIAALTRAYQIDLTDALNEDPESYPSFNAFFTRALKPAERPIDDQGGLVLPADGCIWHGRVVDDGCSTRRPPVLPEIAGT